jgi:hypothetical protein
MPPPQALGPQQLVDPAPLDRDPPLLIEVVPQPVERPGAERQAQVLRVGQGRGEDRGSLVGVVGVRAARAGAVLQGGQATFIEPVDPGRDGGPGDVQFAGDVGGRSAFGDSQDDPGPLDEPSRCGAGMGEPLEFTPLVGGQFAEGDSGWHGAPPWG